MSSTSPMSSIIDAHHHIWLKQDLPWLNGPMQPRIFGPYESIMRDYAIHEYMEDAQSHNISKSVYVQANWPSDKAVDEVKWVQSCADQTGWPHAIVGYCDLMGDDMEKTLAEQASVSKLMRGVRMQLHWHPIEHYRFAPHPDLMSEKKLHTNLAKIQDYDWLFELQVFAGQMKDAAKLVAAFPTINFVLIHAGMPDDLSDSGFTDWQQGMRRLADNPNCFVKLSGLGTFTHCVCEEDISKIVGSCIDIFGADRCLFGSNFPIEKIWSSFADLMQAYHACLSSYSDEVQAMVLHDNAARLYKL